MGWIIFGLFLGIVAVVANFVFVAFINDGNSYDIRNNKAEKKKVNTGLVLVSFIVPVLICTVAASSAQINTGEIGVMTRFGKVTGQELHEGFHFKSPFEVAHIYNVQVQKTEADAAAASKDLQDVKAHVVVNFELEPGKVSEIHRTVGENFETKLIDNSIQESVKANTASFNATELITERKTVKAQIFESLRDRLKPYGITVKELSVTNIDFSPEFTQAIEAKQVAQQQAEQAKFNAQKAENDAQAAINKAKGEAESQSLLNATATGNTIELKRLEVQRAMIDKWNGALPTTSLGSDSNVLFNLQGNK